MNGQLTAHYDFHGVGVRVSAQESLEAVFASCERFWDFYRVPDAHPCPEPQIRIDLQCPSDWESYASLRKEEAPIHIGPLSWYYDGERFILHEDNAIVIGQADHIQGYVRPQDYPDARTFVHFTLNLAFIEALRHHGLYYVHGACLRSPEGKRYLIAGDGRQGKSTLTTSLLLHGYHYLSDDAVFVDMRGEPRVLGYHKHFHVGNDLLPRFMSKGMDELFVPYGKTGKSEVDPDKLFPGQRLMALDKIDVILMPSIIREDRTRIDTCPKAEILANFFVASTQVFFDKRLAVRHLEALRQLTEQSRGYSFQAARDVYENPKLYHDLIKDL